jgi:putative peptidoglycan lipid II flippase
MPEVRNVGRLMAPRLLGVAVVQLNFLLNTILASYQSEGSITALGLAFPLMIMPEAAIAQSIAIAALPTFSAQVARKKIDEMRTSLSGSLQAAFLLSFPAMVGLILLRKPIVQVLYEGSSFSAESTQLVAWALLWYAAGLVSHSIVEISSRAFYALHDTRTPVLVGIGAMSLNLLFSFLFVWLFEQLKWMPHGGLALANSAATSLEAVLLIWLMRKRLDGLGGANSKPELLKIVLAGGIMGLCIWLGLKYLDTAAPFATILIAVLSGLAIFLVSLITLRVQMVKDTLKIIPQKSKK